MLLQDIIEEADLLSPNALSTDRKIKYFNEIQRKIYRDFPQNVTSYFFYTVANVQNYVLPSDCNLENIESVFVDDKSFDYMTNEDRHQDGRFYIIENGEIILGEIPLDQMEGYVIYKQTPTDLTINDLTNDVPFLPDYPEIFIFGLAAKLALLTGNFNEAAQYEAREISVRQYAIQKIRTIKIEKVRHVRRWY